MKKRSKIEVYQDKAGEYRWRFIAPNGRIMADSAEGYKRSYGAALAATRVMRYIVNYDERPRIKFLRA